MSDSPRGLRFLANRLVQWRAHERGDEGISLIECIVAIALLVIILLPSTIFIIDGNRFSYESHLQAEATTLATQAIEGLQAQAGQGLLPGGFQSTTQSVDEIQNRKTIYTISTTWTTVRQGTNQSICTSGVGPSQQIWLAQVSVSWNNMQGASPVVQTTEISPGQAGAFQQSAGELAVALSLDGTTTNLYTGSTVRATLTGAWGNGNPIPAVPNGQRITARGRSSASRGGPPSGCIIFQSMDPTQGWVYTLSLANNPTIVSGQEYSDSNPNGPLVVQNIKLQAGVPQILPVVVNAGTPLAINYVAPATSCSGAPGALVPPATTSEIPVTVSNTNLTYANNQWIAYGASPFTSLLLYPYSNQTQIWAGDGNNGNQATYGVVPVVDTPCTVNAAAGSGGTSVNLRLYPLSFTYSGAPASLTAQEVGGSGYTYALAYAAGTSATSLPLGQYKLGDGAGGVTVAGNAAVVWVTPTGECVVASATASPPNPCNKATFAAVTS